MTTRRLTRGVLAAGFVLIGAGAAAQPPTPAVEPSALAERYIDRSGGVSVEDAVSLAIAQEPSLRAARAETDGALGARTQAALRPNPTLSFEHREEPAGSDNQTMVSVEWPLDLFRRGPRMAVADREVEATERSVDDRTRVLASDVRVRYGRAAAAVRDVATADSLAVSARRAFDLIRRRVDEGASPPLERDQFEVELLRFEADRLLAAGRADAAMVELRRILGLPADAPLALRDTLESLVALALQADRALQAAPVGVRPADLATALERPDIQEAEARVRVAEARVDHARTAGRLDVSLFGSYARMDAGFAQSGLNRQGVPERVQGVFHSVAGGAMLSVPFRNRNQGEVAAAEAERVGAAARLEAARLAAQADVAAAVAEAARARDALVLIERSVRLARQNLDVTRQTYELGRATVSEVLAEQRRYFDVERAHTDTLYRAYEMRTALNRARGER